MLKRDSKFKIILIMTILLYIPSSVELRAKNSSFNQQGEFDPEKLLPSTTTRLTQISSNAIQQQEEVIDFLMDSWDINEILKDNLASTVEIICQAVTAIPSVQISSEMTNKILSDFNLILTTNLTNSKETLNITNEGLFYIVRDGDRQVSTNMNLWIAKALLTLDPSLYTSSIEMTQNIMQALELYLRGQPPASYFQSSILLDPTENPIPGSISPIALFQDQIMAMTIYHQLSYEISDDQVLEYFERIFHLENQTMNNKEGFLDYNLSYTLGLEFGFLHAERDQVLERFNYQNNISFFYFRDGLYLLEYYFNQIRDFSTEADRERYDYYDPFFASLYLDQLIRLLADIQVLFRHKEILYYDRLSTYDFETTLPIYPGNRIYISDQFAFIDLLSRMANWYSSSKLSIDFQTFGKQIQKLAIFLWDYLTIEAYSTSSGGRAASNVNTISGHFYAYYSVTLGLYLFDNTSQGSLIKANIFALNGLGTIFPFQLMIEYETPITKRDNQSILIQIIPLTKGNSSGLSINSKLLLNVPAESINTIIATPTITPETNYSTRYNFSISEEGSITFSIHLSHQRVEFFNLQAFFLVLRSLTMKVLVDPSTPTQGDKILIHFEIRDNTGLLRTNIKYFAILDSESWKKPLLLANQSLYTPTGENPIIINSSQTKSDLNCYFLVHKDAYYPVETNVTIHFQTKLNFLVEWLAWLILESDMGAWLGTIAGLSAVLWGLYIKFINRLLRRVKICQYCGGRWSTKYPVCPHCGRVVNPKKIKNDSPLFKELEDNQEEITSEA
ncbi:MAG: hypothetical protein JSW11_08240 [Candidatus Heimdallarchaeota archaeon]|nr:MAG: hypothetical protein JSW11_08240 [Candidatus Heimdallarchaeota archaeon]